MVIFGQRLKNWALMVGITTLTPFSSYAFKEASSLGSRNKPIRLAIIPTHQATRSIGHNSGLAKCLEKESKLYWDLIIPNNNIAVVEGLGSKNLDVVVGDIMTFFLARSKYQAKPILQVGHYGFKEYGSVIVSLQKKGIRTLEDLKGKKFAFACSDTTSISSCILPKLRMKELGIEPAKELIAGSMDAALTAVVQGKVDLAGAFYSKPELDEKGHILKHRDARKNLLPTFPHIFEETKIIWQTEHIPNEPVMVRSDFPSELLDTLQKVMPHCFRLHPGINDIDNLFPLDPDNNMYDDYMKKISDSGVNFGQVLYEKNKKKG
jgi:phosphonate transport system substrate-binding protein